MEILNYYLKGYIECITWILSEPDAIDVDYGFYKLHELEKELQAYVEQCKKEGEYAY